MANQESSLKLRSAETEDIKGEQERALKLLPTEILSTEAVTGEEDCSLKMCPAERKAISDTNVAAATQKVAPGTCFSELGKYVDADKTMGEEEKASDLSVASYRVRSA